MVAEGRGWMNEGEEDHHLEQSVLMVKLRQIALRSVQHLHQQQQQQQQQQQTNPPRMCGVMDWLVLY